MLEYMRRGLSFDIINSLNKLIIKPTNKLNHPPQRTLCGGWRCVTARGLIDSSERRAVNSDTLEIEHTHRKCLFTDE